MDREAYSIIEPDDVHNTGIAIGRC